MSFLHGVWHWCVVVPFALLNVGIGICQLIAFGFVALAILYFVSGWIHDWLGKLFGEK